MKKKYIIPIFVPHLGCPNDCTFCNQKKISGQKNNISMDEVKKTIEYYLDNFRSEDRYVEIAFFGGSFTGIEVDIQEKLLSIANEYIKNGRVNSIRISTRPDYINQDILNLLKKYNVGTIELGVQSANDFVLNKCRRGHSFKDVKTASKLIRKNKFILGHQMMVGLPDSNQKDEIETARKLIKLHPKIVRIYPVLVIKDTKLADDYIKGEYRPNTVEQAVETSAILLKMFNKKKIDVIRIGLQNTDEICNPGNEGSQVIAGPYHPAFRQLVESRICYDEISKKIRKMNNKIKRVTFAVNDNEINNFVGHKKENVKRIKEIYNVDLITKKDNSVKGYKVIGIE